MIMKKQILYILFILLTFQCFSQSFTPEFEFQLYFEDAAGNKDTLIIGDASVATNLIDTVFGEENIINQPWNSVFEVRASNKYWEGYPFADTALMQAKKAIVNKDEVGNNYITFDIKAENWPVTISWDSTLFHGQNDSLQYAGSWMTAWEYGQWWDGGGQPLYLYNQNQMLLTNEVLPQTSLNNILTSLYTTNNNDTIYTMWFNFQDSSAFTMSIKNNEKADKILFFPNPFEDFFYIQGVEASTIESIRSYDLKGQKQKLQQDGTKFSLPKSPLGIYIVEIRLKNKNGKYYYKLIKR
jgi:hypothetical protein